MNFEDASPVARTSTGGGRKPAPNPYIDVIAQIALKTNKDTGKPLAKAGPVTIAKDEAFDTVVNRHKRWLSDAGEKATPPVTVQSHFEETGDGNAKVTFWTVKRQYRPRAETVATETASTTQTVAPTVSK